LLRHGVQYKLKITEAHIAPSHPLKVVTKVDIVETVPQRIACKTTDQCYQCQPTRDAKLSWKEWMVNYRDQWLSVYKNLTSMTSVLDWLDWIEQCFTSPPTQYRLYGRQFLQVKRSNQQY